MNISIIAAIKKHIPETIKIGLIPKNPNNIPPITGPIKLESELTILISELACINPSEGTRTGTLACTAG